MADNTRALIEQTARRYAAQFDVPLDLVLAIIEVESSYNPRAESPLGAQGLMQLMPHMQRTYNVEDPFDIDQSIRGGVSFLKHLLDKYPDQNVAIAAYNAGEKEVDRYGGIPPFPETREYVSKVFSIAVPFTGRSEQAAIRPIQERWFYPDRGDKDSMGENLLASDEMVGDDGRPLPSNDPARQGILLSFQGKEPSPEELEEIFRTVDPEGFITREDAAALAAGATSSSGAIAKIVKRILPWTKQAAKTAVGVGGKFAWPLSVVTGVAGYGAELWRQSQVPREVGRFGVESWPRSRYGMHYEGAPDTPEEAQYAALVAGLQELVGEGAFGVIGEGIGALGKAWKMTGLPKLSRTKMQEQTGASIRDYVAKGGISPTPAGAKKAEEAMKVGDKAVQAVVKQADEVLGTPGNPLAVDVGEVFKAAEEALPTMNIDVRGATPLLRNAFDDLTEGIVKQHPTGAPGVLAAANPLYQPIPLGSSLRVTLGEADSMRRSANRHASKFFGSDDLHGNPGAKVYAAIGKAWKNAMAKTMDTAEGFGALHQGETGFFSRPGRLFPHPRRFAQRFESQVEAVQQWGNARKLALEQSRQPASGLYAGAAAFSAPTLVGHMLGGAPGAVAGGAAGLAAASQLSPRMRSLTGGMLYRAGRGLPARVPMNVVRGAGAYGSGPTNKPERGESTPLTNFALTRPLGSGYERSLFPTTQTPNRLLRELQQQNPGLRRLPFQNTR